MMRRAASRALAVLGACLALCPLAATAQEDDWEARAARAAAEDAPVDTGGAPGTRIPVDRTPPPAAVTPDPRAHIREADRKVAEKHARELAARRTAEQEAIAPLIDQLARGRSVHRGTLRDLRRRATNLQTRLEAARQDKARAEAAIKAYDDNVDWLTGAVETVGGALGGRDPEAEAEANKQVAERNIAELEAQLRNVTGAYEAEVAEAQAFERRLNIEIAKRQEDARSQLEASRIDAARDLAVAYHTEAEVLAEGAREFEQRILLTDVAIRQAERNGLEDVAEQFRKDKKKRIDAYEAWLERHNAILSGRRAELDRAYAQNRADGIGPTNDYLLESKLRTQARADGRDPLAATDFVDRAAVERSRESAESVVEGAPGSSEHLSIFTEVSGDSLLEFARDYGDEAGKTYGSWEGFYNRVLRGAVWGTLKGVGNLVKDLFLLLVELGDTAGEGIEDIIERLTGAELDLFGDENLAALRSFAVTAHNLAGPDDQAAMEELDRLVTAAEAIGRAIKRKTEQMAATEEGVVKSIQLVQEGAVNLVGVETVALQGLSKGSKLLRGLNKTDELVEAGIAAERAGDAASVTGRAEDLAGAGGRVADAAPAPRIADADLAVGVGTDGKPAVTGGTIRLDDGTEAVLTPDAELGAGSFTTTFNARRADGSAVLAADGTPLVIKITKAGDDGLDRIGYEVLQGLDANVVEVPRVHGTTRIGDGQGAYSGGVVAVVDEAPTDFRKVTGGPERAPDGTVLRAADGGMTAGQAIAFDDAMRAINETGWVWLDNKADNYAFRHLGGDNWKLVILDPGGMVPITNLDPSLARKVQAFIDNPRPLIESGELFGPDVDMRASVLAEILAERFPGAVDLDALNRMLGLPEGQGYQTLVRELEGALPYNPQNGMQFPRTGRLAAAETPEELAAARRALRAEQEAAGGPAAGAIDPALAGARPRTGAADDVAPARAPDAEVEARTATQTPRVCPVGQRRLDLVSRIRSKLARLRSNIVPSHGEVFVDVAVKRNEVVMVRPVNQFSTRLISDNFATKNMGIKGKSANWGPQRGTIPVDPRYSKLGKPGDKVPSAEQLRIYENYNRRALGLEYQTPGKNAAGEIIRNADGEVAEWVTHAPEPPIAQAVPYQGPDGEEIMVLADLNTGKPITADYDLFAVGTQKGHGEVLPFDPDLGVISETEMATVEWINEGVKAKGYTGGNVAHHGPANRFEKALSQQADFPVTAFTPDGNAHTINSIEELNDFYNTWRALGYDLPAHPDWPLDPDLKPSGRFGPLAEDPEWAARAAAAGIVTSAGVTGADGCGASEGLEPFSQDHVYAADESGREQAGRPITGTGGSSTAQTAVSLGGDFPAGIPAIQFEFGPGYRSWDDDTWVSLCPPACDDDDIAQRFFSGPFDVTVEQVFNQLGNAPFDPNDPLAGSLEDQGGQDPATLLPSPVPATPSVPVTSPTPGAPSTPSAPANPLSSYGGNYTGDNGCSIGSTTFATDGANAFTLTLPSNGTVPFDISGGNAGDSRSTNLVIFGAPGHTCGASAFSGDSQFNLNCFNTSGGSCNELFTR